MSKKQKDESQEEKKESLTQEDTECMYNKFFIMSIKNETQINNMCKRFEESMNKVLLSFNKQNENLESVMKINSNVEETLCHVLLAIRQNEYLQAYIPCEKDPERKVVGSCETNFKWNKDIKKITQGDEI